MIVESVVNTWLYLEHAEEVIATTSLIVQTVGLYCQHKKKRERKGKERKHEEEKGAGLRRHSGVYGM